VLLLDAGERERLGPDEIAALGEYAAIVWRGAGAEAINELAEHEYITSDSTSTALTTKNYAATP
jgi:hypothetical protein